MGEGNKNRILYYDVIRAVACLSVLIIHFNASFSAWSGGVFTYPNAVFPNNIFNNSVYLGDFGVSLSTESDSFLFILCSGWRGLLPRRWGL